MSKVLAMFAMMAFVFAVGVQAKEKGMDANMAGKEMTVKGKVEVKKDTAGTPTSVEIKSMMKSYHVTMDAKGSELAQMEGKHVEATGMVSKQGKEHWLTVTSFQEKMKGKETK